MNIWYIACLIVQRLQQSITCGLLNMMVDNYRCGFTFLFGLKMFWIILGSLQVNILDNAMEGQDMKIFP